MTRTGLYYMASGQSGEHEDWWTLVKNEDGSHYVEHDWERKDALIGDSANGPDKLSVDQEMAVAPQPVVAKLKLALAL